MAAARLKGFYARSDVRLVTPEEANERQRIFSSVLWRASAELISEWCCVPLETAVSWKAGKSLPSPTALRLFTLHDDQKVLADPVWNGWLVSGHTLVDPDGNATTQEQLRAYYFVYQLAAELSRGTRGCAGALPQAAARLRWLMLPIIATAKARAV